MRKSPDWDWKASLCNAKPLIATQVTPVYPERAVQTRQQDTIEFIVHGYEGGRVEIHEWGGNSWLKSAGEEAPKQWRWRPFLLRGRPIEFQASVYFTFGLSPDGPRVQTLFTKETK